MSLLSRKVDYAIVVLSYLYGRTEGASAREIAEHFDLSRGFVANILKSLCHQGFIASHRGVRGGYVAHRPAESVRLADLMEALDDPFQLTTCSEGSHDEDCTLMRCCPVRHGLASVHERMREVLRQVTLAELFRPVASEATTQFGLEVTRLARLPLPAGA